jgi:hypothetical protein
MKTHSSAMPSAVTALTAAGLLLLAACGASAAPTAGPVTAAAGASATGNPATGIPATGNPATADSVLDAPPVSQPNATPGAGATTAFADPCTLLTQAEVDTAVGQPLSPGKQVATLDDCLWTSADFTASVDVTVSDWTGIKNAATADGTKTPAVVAGIGDEALGDPGLLSVRKGDAGFLLTFDYPDMQAAPDQGLAQATILADAVLSRL